MVTTIFDIDTYPQNLLYAAIFGFLPSLVIRLLQQRTDQVLSQIQSSSAGDHKSSDSSAAEGNGNSGASPTSATVVIDTTLAKRQTVQATLNNQQGKVASDGNAVEATPNGQTVDTASNS